jgi:hypothetical protein
MVGVFAIALGIASIWAGTFQVRAALQDGTFYGQNAVKYRESRSDGPLAFWTNFCFRAALIPAGVWCIYEGVVILARSL